MIFNGCIIDSSKYCSWCIKAEGGHAQGRFHGNCWLGGAEGWMKEGDHSNKHHCAYCAKPKENESRTYECNAIRRDFLQVWHVSCRSDRKSVKKLLYLLMGRCTPDAMCDVCCMTMVMLWCVMGVSTLEVSTTPFGKNIWSSKYMLYTRKESINEANNK